MLLVVNLFHVVLRLVWDVGSDALALLLVVVILGCRWYVIHAPCRLLSLIFMLLDVVLSIEMGFFCGMRWEAPSILLILRFRKRSMPITGPSFCLCLVDKLIEIIWRGQRRILSKIYLHLYFWHLVFILILLFLQQVQNRGWWFPPVVRCASLELLITKWISSSVIRWLSVMLPAKTVLLRC